MHHDGQGLLVATRSADRFYSLLNRIVLDHEIAIEAVAPADENAQAVYQYLVGSEPGVAS
jgi:ABC-2 type transport system ATP-binding protein